jgi:hypothetical protein
MAALRDQVARTAAVVGSVAPDTFGAPPETRVEMLKAALKRLGLYVDAQAHSLPGSRARQNQIPIMTDAAMSLGLLISARV